MDGGWSDGCFYHWDGYIYEAAACPAEVGGYNLYLPLNGTWQYALTFNLYPTGELLSLTAVTGEWVVFFKDGSISGASSNQLSAQALAAFANPAIINLILNLN